MNSGRIGVAAMALAAALASPAGALLDYRMTHFQRIPTVQPGDTLIVNIVNGSQAQMGQAGLYLADGSEVMKVTRSLGVAGSDNEILTLRWRNDAAQPLSGMVLGASFSQDSEHVHLSLAMLDSNLRVSAIIDQGALWEQGEAHGHGGADGGGGGGGHNAMGAMISTFQNYPNPFRVSDGTHIVYSVDGFISEITVRVWSSDGRLVKTLHVHTPANRYVLSWDGRDSEGRRVKTGVYYAEIMVAGDSGTVRKILPMAAIGG